MELDIAAILPTIVALIVGVLSGFASYRVSRAQTLEATANSENNVAMRWKEFAEAQKEMAEELSLKISNLDKEFRLRDDEYRDMLREYNLATEHIRITWDWIDAGAHPPAPVRPRRLYLIIHNTNTPEDSAGEERNEVSQNEPS